MSLELQTLIFSISLVGHEFVFIEVEKELCFYSCLNDISEKAESLPPEDRKKYAEHVSYVRVCEYSSKIVM